MSQNEGECLAALEHLMDEFFASPTTNERKREIESQLTNFSNQCDCWQFCIYFMRHTANQYVSMYALSTLETVINRQWVSLEWEHRLQLKTTLYNYLVEDDLGAPHFLRHKLAKLVVDIARFDWPHFYPDYFTNVIQLLQNERGQLLGLILLRTTSEEFTSDRPDLSSSRKEQLCRLLQQHIPEVFHILCRILDTIGAKPKHTATTTPPPSPTHPGSAPHLAHLITPDSFRPDTKDITKEALATTQHLFSWAQLTHVPLALVKAIFRFTIVSSDGYVQDEDEVSILAMSAINELLYRKCVPPGTQSLFEVVYEHIEQLLKDILNPTSSKVDCLSNDFVDKLCEMLSLLIEQHLWRLETRPGFTALEFLLLLFQLTLQLPSLHCYLQCLTIWATFIKQLKSQNAYKYTEALLGVVSTTLNKMQFLYNQLQLEEADCESVSDENETEWDVFLKTSIEVIATAAEYKQTEIFNQVLIPWKSAAEVYCVLENVVDHRNGVLTIDKSEVERLHCILKDLSSLTQTLARLSTFFLEKDTDTYKTSEIVIDNFLKKLIHCAYIAKNAKFCSLKMENKRLVDDFTDVHSHMLAALKTWSSLLPLSTEITNQSLHQLFDVSIPVLLDQRQQPSKISHAAAHLVLHLTGTVFPPTLIVMPGVTEFLQSAPRLQFNSNETTDVINSAVCNLLLRPWGELAQADSAQRNVLISMFFDGLTRSFCDVRAGSTEAKVVACVASTLTSLSHIVEFCKNFPSSSKKLLYLGIQASVDHALEIFPEYSKHPEVGDHILMLFLNVLGVLQQQLGIENMKRAVDVFLDVAVRQQQTKNLSGLDKLLQILQIVVELPGSSYKHFLSGILQLCMEHVYPLVICQANEQPYVIIALLSLLHSILLHRWQYFYISQVRLGHSPGCSEMGQEPDSPQQPELLLAVLQVFGQALLQPDINTFRTSLLALEDLNTKWKLYHKTLFRERLLCQFITVLLHTLLDQGHALLIDDMLLTLFNMAAVNFQGFFTTFVPEFLQNMDLLTPTQRDSLKQSFNQETDMPTFIRQVQVFVNDVRCYRLCNASLPPGSVVL